MIFVTPRKHGKTARQPQLVSGIQAREVVPQYLPQSVPPELGEIVWSGSAGAQLRCTEHGIPMARIEYRYTWECGLGCAITDEQLQYHEMQTEYRRTQGVSAARREPEPVVTHGCGCEPDPVVFGHYSCRGYTLRGPNPHD